MFNSELFQSTAIFIGMSEARVPLLVRVTPGLKSKLEEIATSERRSLSRQVELLLERCVAMQDTHSSTLAPTAGTEKKRKSQRH